MTDHVFRHIAIKCLLYWFPLAVALSFVFAGIYGAVQQDIRIGANHPQVQMSEDAAYALSTGDSVSSVLPVHTIDMTKSLAPYLILFDSNGHPLGSSVQLNNTIPTLPSGVFTAARNQGEDRFTWQPESGVRSAVVVTYFSGMHSGFVLAGRSLREVENRTGTLLQDLLAGWLLTLVVTFLSLFLVIWLQWKYRIPVSAIAAMKEDT